MLILLELSMTFCPRHALFVFRPVFLVAFQTMFLLLFYIQLCFVQHCQNKMIFED